MRRLLVFILLLSFFTYPLTTETANASSAPINLGFEVNDSVLHPDQPIVYATKLGSKTIHAINFETGKKETLTLPYPANLYVYNGTKYLGKATVDSYGKYKVPIVLQKRGVTLKVHAVDKANNKSKETSIKVS